MPKTEKKIAAYDQMLHHIKDQLTSESHDFIQSLKQAQEKIQEMEQLSEEEIREIADCLKRDVEDITLYLAEGNEFGRWLRFDLSLIEDRLIELFLGVADPTKLAHLKLRDSAYWDSEYKSGEITGIGSLTCAQCGHSLEFHKTGLIPPCPECHGETFRRKKPD